MKTQLFTAVCLLMLLSCNSNTNKKTEAPTIKNGTMEKTGNFPRATWVSNTNVYEVNVRQYTKEGTFNAFAAELPRLKLMGVETIWFMPITPIAQKNKKGTLGSPYACSDYTGINPEFGTLEDFKNLVNSAHDMGMKVIIDWVANHTGWDHRWTKEHPDYYLMDSSTNDFHIASGMDDIIELNFANPALRKAMIDAMNYWVTETKIDGFRCDLASWVEQDFWVEARTALEKTKNLFWLAELDPTENQNYMEVFDAAYSWKWMHLTEDYYKKQLPLADLKNLLMQYDSTGRENHLKLWFTTNHDENSWNGTEYEKYGAMAQTLAAFSFTWKGIPLIYSGQELPNNKRLEFFEKDAIQWNGKYLVAPMYTDFLKLRKEHKALNASDSSKTFLLHSDNAENQLLGYLRKNGDDEVLVLLNMSKEFLKFKITDNVFSGNFRAAYSTGETIDFTSNKSFEMQPWEYLIYVKQ